MKYLALLLLPFMANAAGKIINADIAPSGTANIAPNKLAASTPNNVCTFDASGYIAGGIAPGTSGNVLTSNGTNWTSAANTAALSVGALDAQAANANGLALVSNVLSAQSADATHPGLVNNTAQTLGAGTKTVDNLIDSGLTASQAVVTDGSKQLASLAYGTASSASSLVQRDANQNAFANNFTSKGTNVVSAGGTTTLTAASTRLQNLTGTLAQTFQLPDATTLTIGSVWEFDNNSSGVLSVTDGSGGALGTVPSGGYARYKTTAVSTTAGAWDWHYLIPKNSLWGTAGATVTGTLNVTGTTTLDTALNGVLQASSGVVSASTVPNGSLANMANGTTKCRTTAGTGSPEDCTAAQEAAILDGFFVDSMAAMDSQTKSATNGAVITAGGQLALQSASPGFPGYVSDNAQTFTGAKTFTSAPIVTAGIKVQETTGSGSNKVTITEPEDIAADFTFPLPVSDATAQDGTMALFRTSTGSQWKVPGGGTGGNSAYLALHTGNTSGSTYTRIRRFSSSDTSQAGSAITYTDSSTDGASVTINNSGVLSISYCDFSTVAWAIGITINESLGTTGNTAIDTPVTYAQGQRGLTATVSNVPNCVSSNLKVSVNDVIRFHLQSGTAANVTDDRTMVTMHLIY